LIEKIKSLGGPEMVNWEKIYASLADPTLESIIKAKVSDIELLKFNKAEAIKTAKVNIDKYIQERGSESTKAAEGRLNDTKQHLDGLTSKFDFLKPKTIDPKADAATKKAAEDHNAWVKDVNDNIAYSLQKDDPETRAILIAGMVNLMHLGPRHEALKAAHEAATAKIKELEASIAKIKGASVNRIREGNAPASGDLPKPKTDEHRFNVPATQSLDDIAKEIMERRKAAGQ
jgi:hypothetical protein